MNTENMNTELLDSVNEFKSGFLDTYPKVKNASKLISDFNSILNDSKEENKEQAQIITEITELLNNSNLQKFAEADCSVETLQENLRIQYEDKREHNGNEEEFAEIAETAAQDAIGIKLEADLVVNGDEDHDEAGLKDLVNRLLESLV